MCDLKALCTELTTKQTIEIFGKVYTIQNCAFATDGTILKLSAYLVSGSTSLTLFTEMSNLPDKDNQKI